MNGLHSAGCRYLFSGKWAVIDGCKEEHPENVDLQRHSAPEDWQGKNRLASKDKTEREHG